MISFVRDPFEQLYLRRRGSRLRPQNINELDPYRARIAVTTAALIGAAAIGAAGSIGSAVIGSHAAKTAADTQAAAADQIRQEALDAGKTATGQVNDATTAANADITSGTDAGSQEIRAAIASGNGTIDAAKAQQLAALKPYLDAGTASITDVQQILNGTGDGTLGQNFSFTSKDWENDPGYAFIRQQAQTALARSQAARGASFGGGTVRSTARLETGLASTHLDDAFTRALSTYQANRATTLARLQGLTGLVGTGLSATGVQNQDIGNAAQLENSNFLTGGQLLNQNDVNASNKIAANKINAGMYAGNTGLQATAIAANALGTKAQAQATGDINSANAWQTGIGGVINAFQPAVYQYGLPVSTGNTLGTAAPAPGSTGSAPGTPGYGVYTPPNSTSYGG